MTFEITPESVGDDSAHQPQPQIAPPLTGADAKELRRVIMRAANLGVKLHRSMTYTEGPGRWSGITQERRSILDETPPYSDCSAFATWCYWDASRWLDMPDIVNGQDWEAGYTGTMVQHGTAIPLADGQLGDLVFYGAVSLPYHVAIFAGNGEVVSMGRPGAPELVPVGAASMCRRYF